MKSVLFISELRKVAGGAGVIGGGWKGTVINGWCNSDGTETLEIMVEDGSTQTCYIIYVTA